MLGDKFKAFKGQGSVFVQDVLAVGAASYHFEAIDNIYLSYENRTWAEQFAPLDDGSKLPDRKMFSNVKFPDELTFTGEIIWDPTWYNFTKWGYNFMLTDDGKKIKSGETTVSFIDGTTGVVEYGDGDYQLSYVKLD